MNNKIGLTLIVATLAMASCQKKESIIFDENNLKVSVSKPIEGQMFMNGDTVFIKAQASYTTELHGYALKISNKEDSNNIYFDVDNHLHDKSITIDTFWVVSVPKATELTLSFTIEADHDGNEKTTTTNFHAHL